MSKICKCYVDWLCSEAVKSHRSRTCCLWKRFVCKASKASTSVCSQLGCTGTSSIGKSSKVVYLNVGGSLPCKAGMFTVRPGKEPTKLAVFSSVVFFRPLQVVTNRKVFLLEPWPGEAFGPSEQPSFWNLGPV